MRDAPLARLHREAMGLPARKCRGAPQKEEMGVAVLAEELTRSLAVTEDSEAQCEQGLCALHMDCVLGLLLWTMLL